MKKTFTAVLLAAAGLASCSKDNNNDNQPPQTIVQKGTPATVNNGKGVTWIEASTDNKPVTVGIMLTADALNDNGFTTRHEGHDGASVFHLDLPANRVITPFKHITVDWNPHGHPPENVYTKAHFDFHFYMVTKEDLDKIPTFETDSTKFKVYPGPGYMPADYFPIPGGQAKMGVHWADPKSPELNPGGTFTQTFIYGSYNGAVNFYEPMITKEYLQGLNGTFERAIPQPQKFSTAGYYPTKMIIQKLQNGYEIKLTDFVFRQKS